MPLASPLSLRFSSISRCFCSFSNSKLWNISTEVRDALREGKGVVALESTVLTHGLPHPTNFQVGLRVESIIREQGAVPATIALLDGQIRVGLRADELERISLPGNEPIKVSRRDLANCLAGKKIGGTTVAATMWVAHKAGIRVFATGGIGGVHRDGQNTMDISADLTELARTPVAVVCAGAKSILDIGRTLEYLETHSVDVVVLDQHSPNFPGFFSPRTDYKAPHHTGSLAEIADILVLSTRLGLPNGTLIACPIPEEYTGEGQMIAKAVDKALEEAKEAGIRGKGLSPYILDRVSQGTGSASLKANIALLENNARIGAHLAKIYAHKMTNNALRRNSPIIMSQKEKKEEKEEEDKHTKRAPKIICAGASIVDVQVFLDSAPFSSSSSSSSASVGAYFSSRIGHCPGGVGRNHADALARLGCRVTLLSALGQDLFGCFLEQKYSHLDWSHVLRVPDVATASSVGICVGGSSISQGFIAVDEIMSRMGEEYIESKAEQIADADFVLMDANLDVRTIRKLVQMARNNGTKVWFEPTNWLKVSKLFEALGTQALNELDVISPNLRELEMLTRELKDRRAEQFVDELKTFGQLSAAPSPNAFCEWITDTRIPDALCPPSLSLMLITCDAKGVILLNRSSSSSSSPSSPTVHAHFVPPPDIRPDQIVSVSGAGDCFNCGFLSARLDGLNIAEAAEMARDCARISLCSAEVVPADIGRWRRFQCGDSKEFPTHTDEDQ